MKLKALLFGVLWMLFIQLSELNVCALARKQLALKIPLQDPCNKCDLIDANKKDQDFTKKIINTRSLNIEMDTSTTFKDHVHTHQHKKSTRRTLSQKHVYEGKKERWLAVDEVDYLGPRTHPPTKPPRK